MCNGPATPSTAGCVSVPNPNIVAAVMEATLLWTASNWFGDMATRERNSFLPAPTHTSRVAAVTHGIAFSDFWSVVLRSSAQGGHNEDWQATATVIGAASTLLSHAHRSQVAALPHVVPAVSWGMAVGLSVEVAEGNMASVGVV